MADIRVFFSPILYPLRVHRLGSGSGWWLDSLLIWQVTFYVNSWKYLLPLGGLPFHFYKNVFWWAYVLICNVQFINISIYLWPV